MVVCVYWTMSASEWHLVSTDCINCCGSTGCAALQAYVHRILSRRKMLTAVRINRMRQSFEMHESGSEHLDKSLHWHLTLASTCPHSHYLQAHNAVAVRDDNTHFISYT